MKKKKKPTVAILLDNLNEDYGNSLWKVIVHELREQDINVLCFPGGALFTAEYDHIHRNSLFELVDMKQLDGIIAFSGGLANFCKISELESFLNLFFPLPLISIGINLPRIPSIIVDNAIGMYQLVSHFIEEHHYKRIAFICGPADVEDANARFDAYKQALQDHYLPLIPELILSGDFTRKRGKEAAGELLDKCGGRFEALIAANDYMALNAMHIFRNRGIAVPGDIAIGGFDNVPETLGYSPTLTTVDQPCIQLGQQAVVNMLKLLNGEEVPDVEELPTQLIVRESCGCLDYFYKNVSGRISAAGRAEGAHNPADPQSLLTVVIRESPFVCCWFGSLNWLKELIRTLLPAGDTSGGETFLLCLKKWVTKSFARGIQLAGWFDLLETLLRHISDAKGEAQIQSLRIRSLKLLGLLNENALNWGFTKIREQDKGFNLGSLITAFDMKSLAELIRDELPRLEIDSCFLSLYVEPPDSCAKSEGKKQSGFSADQAAGRQYAQLFTYYDFKGVYKELVSTPFPSRQLIPGGIREGNHAFGYIVLPIFFKGDKFGFGVYEIGSINDGLIFENILRLISDAVMSCSLVSKIQSYASNLEMMVEERTSQLKKTQKQLVSAAHEAGMADVAVNIIHNTGNLLTSISISIQSLLENAGHSKLSGLAGANSLLQKVSDSNASGGLKKTLVDYYHEIHRLLKNDQVHLSEELLMLLRRVSQLQFFLKSQEQYTHAMALNETLDLVELVDGVLVESEYLFGEEKIRIVRKFPAKGKVLMKVQRYKLSNAFKQILVNSREAMQQVPEKIITIEVSKSPKRVLIKITDTGCGIEKENLKTIFNFGFSTKKDRPGFSLHTCANFLTEMRGSLQAHSDGPGKGATFIFQWPVK